MALGKVVSILFRHFFLDITIGINNTEAPIKRSSVSEKGLIMPARFSDAKNDPATRMVASKTNK